MAGLMGQEGLGVSAQVPRVRGILELQGVGCPPRRGFWGLVLGVGSGLSQAPSTWLAESKSPLPPAGVSQLLGPSALLFQLPAVGVPGPPGHWHYAPGSTT